VEAFGGDPEKITIAGQSAGAGSVMAQLSSPMAKGLFRAAIVQSGIIMNFSDTASRSRNTTLEAAEKAGAEFFEKIGVKSLEEARAMCPFELHKLARENALRCSPPLDGIFATQSSVDAMMNDDWGDRPVIFGYNSGEVRMFSRFSGALPATLEELEAAAERFGDRKDEFLALTNCKTDEDVKALMESDAYTSLIISTLLAGSVRAEQGHKAYLYEFDHEIPGEDNPGVYHGAELPFAYDALARMWRPYTGKDYDMARIVNSYWINFIKTGDPNGLTNNGEELPRWDACTKETITRMHFTDKAEQEKAVITPLMRLRYENSYKK